MTLDIWTVRGGFFLPLLDIRRAMRNSTTTQDDRDSVHDNLEGAKAHHSAACTE